ncbi:hypothetical protein D3C81_2207790 [compost metagenome]
MTKGLNHVQQVAHTARQAAECEDGIGVVNGDTCRAELDQLRIGKPAEASRPA